MRRLMIAALGAVLLAGCQTTQNVSELSDDAKFAHMIALEKCRTSHVDGTFERKVTKWTERDIVVYGVSQKEQGWSMADVAVEGRRTHVFFNREKCGYLCGYANWEYYKGKNRLSRLWYALPARKCNDLDASNWPFMKGDRTKSIEVQWDGVGSTTEGQIVIKASDYRDRGAIKFTHPQTNQSCKGKYFVKHGNTSKTTHSGTWDVICYGTDAQFASGEVTVNTNARKLVAFGQDGKGNTLTLAAEF